MACSRRRTQRGVNINHATNDVCKSFCIDRLFSYSNKKLSRCGDSATCEPWDFTKRNIFFRTLLVFLTRIRDHRVLQSGSAAPCSHKDTDAYGAEKNGPIMQYT